MMNDEMKCRVVGYFQTNMDKWHEDFLQMSARKSLWLDKIDEAHNTNPYVSFSFSFVLIATFEHDAKQKIKTRTKNWTKLYETPK